ncbi:hypothetical protein ASG29_09145 [Sphingomonas sp. Leaf412]|uniref:glycerophosphodiester phosphodiesterase family protein n=1 Tax=Sphingomonas sp. Leaf412 TaxID=1736370 RepID=UPI0006F33AF1|nr:glycerophosphodiester phosphodiesterase family protein [Sphingomonas sp. Leaf412]KQT32014.1 hypothetical protein ASG29_09145 [Sphingomonas sp. Leaf412]
MPTNYRALGLGAMMTAFALGHAGTASAQACRSLEQRFGEIMGYNKTNDVMILGHRGFWGSNNPHAVQMPENSTGAIIDADAACIDGIELDIKLSSDNVPFILHDFNVGRTTNYSETKGRRRYNPRTDGTLPEYNPPLSAIRSDEAEKLRLLNPSRAGWSMYTLPKLENVLRFYDLRHFSLPIIFDVKTSEAVKATNSAVRKFVPGGRYKMAMKVNATLYQTPEAFEKDAGDMWAIPVFTTNMLGRINVDAAFNAWFSANAIEVNVKQPWGLMYTLKDRVVEAGKKAGVLHAIPDEDESNGSFYMNTGACCYKLSNLYYEWKPNFKDTDDRRGDLGFLNRERFNLITTDDPNAAAQYFRRQGKRRDHPGAF